MATNLTTILSSSLPPGAQGATGSQGVQGRQGTTGTNGSQGTTGLQGSTGPQGINGSNGSQGATGLQGIQGTTGAGTQGATGLQGIQGRQGTTGAAGPSTSINAAASSAARYLVGVAAVGSTQTASACTSVYMSASTVYGVDFAATSDIRLKNVRGIIEEPLKIVKGISGVHFNWNELAKAHGYNDTHDSEVGVIAQDVQSVLPEAVHEDNRGFLRVSYDRLVPVLVEAVKELNTKVETLQSEIKELRKV